MLRISNIFFRPSIEVLAENELKEARQGLLRAQAALEWAQAVVTYHQARINRLSTYLEVQGHDKTAPSQSDYRDDPTSDFSPRRVHGVP